MMIHVFSPNIHILREQQHQIGHPKHSPKDPDAPLVTDRVGFPVWQTIIS